ncbi:MAG: hypothetical protein FJ318_03860 [SAR202 cluster bacterium]|nr:hypothetical protein [SAR202 cluster bacterium]
MDPTPPALPDDVRRILKQSFLIRATMRTRRSHRLRTVETTYVWDGGSRLYLSGYPGPRDWVANMAANPDVTLHTVEGHPWFDLPARARVLRDRDERVPHLLAFLRHWAGRMGLVQPLFRLALCAIGLHHRLRLPWWGPFYPAKRILDRMPCVEVTLVGPPRPRPGGPPPLSEPIGGRR